MPLLSVLIGVNIRNARARRRGSGHESIRA